MQRRQATTTARRRATAAARRVRRALNRSRREASVEERAVDYAKARGWLARKMNGLGYRSWPDRLFIPRVRASHELLDTLWVEFKRRGEDPTPLQAAMHRDLRQRGQLVVVVDAFEDFQKIFDEANTT